MDVWILILVMLNPTTPHILTIPVEEFDSKQRCISELTILTEAVNGDDETATLICLLDRRPTDMNDGFRPDDFEPANESEETWEGVCPTKGDMIPCRDDPGGENDPNRNWDDPKTLDVKQEEYALLNRRYW